MGGQQSKGKQKRATTPEENEQQQNLPKSASSKSYDEGTSVDTEAGSVTQEMQTNLPSLTEEHSITESDHNVMTGLPGEETPVLNVSFSLEDKEQTKAEETLISKVQKPDSESWNEASLDVVHSKEAKDFNISVNLGENLYVSCKVPDESKNKKKDYSETNNYEKDAVKTPLQSGDNSLLSICNSCSGKEKVSLDCRHDREDSIVTFKLQDIRKASENYHLPLRFDSGGQLKKKATSETEDNRCKCDLADIDYAVNTPHKPIFTNVIFLPDKSKGASPKRYGPKRLGSIYDGMSDDDHEDNHEDGDDDNNISIGKPHDIEKLLDAENLGTITERKTESDIEVTSVSKGEGKGADTLKDRSKADRNEESSSDENRNVNIQEKMNSMGNLAFVEDHFGLHTGSLAEGVSKEFQAPGEYKESNNKPSHMVLDQTMPSRMNEEINNNENKLSEKDTSSIFSHAVTEHHPVQRQEEIEKLKLECAERNSSSNALTLPTVKTEHELKQSKKIDKGMRSLEDKINDQEVVEICEKCKEPRDLCFCLFSVMKTVMSVVGGEPKTPQLGYMRYLKINDKEINWPVLKSAQALYIQGLKSHKTDISEDNRVTFKFCLPTFKGFFGPEQRQLSIKEDNNPVREYECPIDKGESLMTSIEKKFGINLSGFKPSGSIDSSRNMMINDFDECSDEGEESVTDDDDDSSDRSSNYETAFMNSINEGTDDLEESYENNTMYDESEVEAIGSDKKSASMEGVEGSEMENSCYLETPVEFQHEKQVIKCSGFDCKCTGNQDSGFNSGNNSGKNGSTRKEEDIWHLEEEKSHNRSSYNIDQVQTDSLEGCSVHAVLKSRIGSLQGMGSYLYDEFDVKVKSDMAEKENKSENSVLNEHKDENLATDVCNGDFDPVCKEEENKMANIKLEDNENNCQCEQAGEEKVKEFPDEIFQQKYEDENTLDSFETINSFENENESCGSIITNNEFDEDSDCGDLNWSFAEEMHDESKACEVNSFMSYANKGNEEVLSVSCPVVDAGNKSSGINVSREVKSCADDIKSISQEVVFPSEHRKLSVLKQKVHDFPFENDINGDIAHIERNSWHLPSLHEDDDQADESCETRVKKLKISEIAGVHNHCDSGTNIVSEQEDVETTMAEEHEKLNERLENSNMAQTHVADKKHKSLVDDLNAGVKENYIYSTKCENDENMNKGLAFVLRRKVTDIDVDNRLAQISCDETDVKSEVGYVANVKENVKSKNRDVNKRKEDEEVIHIPSTDGSGKVTFIKRIMSSSSGETIKQILSEDVMGASGITLPGSFLSDLVSSDIDFSLPPDELFKMLHERKFGLGGFLGKMRDQPRQHTRRHYDRRPKRPENAKSDFASSFYDSFDRNVDFSEIGKEPESAGQNISPSNDSDSESSRLNNLKRQAAERIVQEFETSSMSSSSVSLQSSRSSSPLPDTDDEDREVKLNDIWNPVLEEEKTKCLKNTKIPPTYRCTVLCVDVSASMQGLPWQQVKDFIPEFLSGLEMKKQTEKMEEYVAMVTFGYKTRIVSQPAKNYAQLSKDLKSLKPEGNSPLLPGIALSLLIQTVRKEMGQHHCKLHDIVLRHRIILLSDGHPSPASLVCTSDDIPDLVQLEACQELQTSLQDWKLPSQHTHIDCVPVGENPNTDLLESICEATDGRMVCLSDVQTLVNSTHNHYIAAQVSKQMLQMKTDQLDVHMFKSLVLSLYPSSTQADISEMVALAEAAHARVLAKLLDGSDSMSTASEDDVHFEPADLQELPKIGTRVAPGPDVSGRILHLAPGKGTVTGHSRKHRGKVFVQWDNGVNTLCNCGHDDKFEVFPEEDKDQHKIDDTIKVGFKVRRGPDWQYGNQDGGGNQLGTVYKIQTNGAVCVRWPNGNRNKYRYNKSGVFDILISDPSDPLGMKMFESEMNKKNNERSNTPVLLPESIGDAIQMPQFGGDAIQLPGCDDARA